MNMRPVAVPLITVDPFFSIWSCNNTLNGEFTKSWTEKPNPILAGLYIDNRFYSMAGVTSEFVPISKKMTQKEVKVSPLTSTYVFENEFAKVTLKFTTPLLLNRLDILTRPVSYIEYDVERKCDDSVKIEFVFGINARCCVDNSKQMVAFKKTDFSLSCGNTVQNPLSQSGDMVMIDWGYLHLCEKNAYVAKVTAWRNIEKVPMNISYNAYEDMPYMMVKKREMSGVITVAYDEIYPIEYFNTPLKETYTKYFDSFSDMVKTSISEYAKIKKMCEDFEEEFDKEVSKFGENYKNITALAYRQAISAHKLVYDENDELLFLSKECESNGCIGTLDVTYPSIPLFLKYNPELVLGMLRPIIKYAKSDAWEYDFAPHDVGTYPIANGQVYGRERCRPEERLSMQMPVEEAGNMILCLGAVAKYSGKIPALFEENKDLIKKWADYLVEYGYDPGNQLCTDDFAGHLAHNCNLSLKAILGIRAYAYLSGDEKYEKIAKEYATKWEKEAKASHGATRLTFDTPDGWSLKYNLVWDNLLGFKMFSDEVKKNEIRQYESKLNRYGVPLDSRADYTKIDWLMWSTRIYDDKEYFDKVCQSIMNMINETEDRVPLTDWYYTSDALHIEFQNRSVVGGLYINLL